jgi:hypothetical protein
MTPTRYRRSNILYAQIEGFVCVRIIVRKGSGELRRLRVCSIWSRPIEFMLPATRRTRRVKERKPFSPLLRSRG